MSNLLANFSSLTTLSLVSCDLKGSFPNTIFHIPTLQNLYLSWNEQLSESIPPFTRNGSNKSLALSLINFSGSIPSSISNLKSLSNVDLFGCQFIGSIPSTFANLTELTHLDLPFNFFTAGSLSSTLFGGLSNLVHLGLNFTQPEEPIPDSFFQLESLESLFLSGNSFNGTFRLNKIPILWSLICQTTSCL